MKILVMIFALPLVGMAQTKPAAIANTLQACKVVHQPGYQWRYNQGPQSAALEAQRKANVAARAAAEQAGKPMPPTPPLVVPAQVMSAFQTGEYKFFENYRAQFTAADAAAKIPAPAAQTTVDAECKRLAAAK